MLRLLRKPSLLFLLCSPILLAGCQHPLAPSVAARQPPPADHALVYARAGNAVQFPALAVETEPCLFDLGLPQSPEPQNPLPATAVQKQPDSLTLQLGDACLLVLKTFTGR